MRVAVLGGGFQGVCAALELATRGVEVDLFDRNTALITQAGARNEGKIHLGYVYAADRSFATAKTMISGALAFAPTVRRWLGSNLDTVARSSRFHYLVHSESMVAPDAIRRHFDAIAGELALRAVVDGHDYFGLDLNEPHRELSDAERRLWYDATRVSAAIETREISIDVIALAAGLRKAVAASPRIRVRLDTSVTGAAHDAHGVDVTFQAASGNRRERYDHAVNALWDGRQEIDRTAGIDAIGTHVYRCKYGLRIADPGIVPPVPSVTIVLGPFGDVVNFGNGELYLSWYPVCLQGLATGSADSAWALDPNGAAALRVARDTLAALAALVPALQRLPRAAVQDAIVRGGIIVARGETDIVDPKSGLHRRYEIGVESHGRYHSIDTGKYTMAPLFARQVADRICALA
jgi:glycine/D-amino acid oxidase-like deaminating enzyme